MTSALHTLIRIGARKSKRVGRGQSSGKGKTAGRGVKGQNARAGRKKRPELRDIIKKLPKRRGYGKNRSHTVNTRLSAPVAISLARLDTLFASGATVSHQSFSSRVKIVSGGEITKALTLKGIAVSASAKAAIEKAGGSVAQS